MELKNRYLALFFFAIVIFVYLLVAPTLTGFTALEVSGPNVSLSDTIYEGGSALTGTFNFTIKGDIPSNSTVKVEIVGGESKSLDLIEVLRAQSINPEQSQTYATAINPGDFKTFDFNSAGSGNFAIKMTKGVLVDNISMVITGLPVSSTYPKNPSISIGNNNYDDWYYLGSFNDYGDYIVPSGLSESDEGQVTLTITNKDTMYCEKVILPLAKDFEIFSKFQTLQPLNTVINVSLNIVEQQQSKYGCMVSKVSDTSSLDWHSCEVHIQDQISGEKYICMNISLTSDSATLNGLSSTDLVKLSKDSVQGSGYQCTKSSSISCNKDTSRDFFIKIKAGAYNENLQTAELLKNWETTPGISRTSLTIYLTNCLTENTSTTLCAVPIVVKSKSAGSLKISDTRVDFRLGGLSETTSLKLYDLSSATTSMFTLPYARGVILSLTQFNVKVPETKTNATVKITVAGKTTIKDIQINPKISNLTAPTEIKIENTKTYLNSVKSSDIVKALKLSDLTNAAYNKILDYEIQVQLIKDSNRTEAAKETAYNNILTEMDTLVKNIPKIITIKAKSSYKPSVILPEDAIAEKIIEDDSYKDAVYSLQSKVDINSEASLADILYFSNVNESVTLIKDIVTIKDTSLTSLDIVKLIPKTIAGSASSIYSSPSPTIIKADPILKFSLTPQNKEIYIVVKKNVMENAGEISTLYIPEQIPTELVSVRCGDGTCNALEDYGTCPEDCKCGDNVCGDDETEESCPDDCKKPPYVLISILGLVAVIGFLIYVYLHGHPERKEKLLSIFKFGKKKKLFKSDADLDKLKQFIKYASSKGYSKDQIKRTLLQKNWTNEQIDEAFKQ